MPLRFACPSCKTSMAVPAAYAGKPGRCTKCKAAVRVPKLDDPGVELTKSAEDRPLVNTLTADVDPSEREEINRAHASIAAAMHTPAPPVVVPALASEPQDELARLRAENERLQLEAERAKLAAERADFERAKAAAGQKAGRTSGRRGAWVPDKDPILAVVLTLMWPGAGRFYVDGCESGVVSSFLSGLALLLVYGMSVIIATKADEAYARARLIGARSDFDPALWLLPLAVLIAFYGYQLVYVYGRALAQRRRHIESTR